uniref:Thioredoxin domain-containing protein n=1 Tax=Pyrodinium bahamense TaxID=73915 RepID=A0A7S0FZY3_9DINO|mmetsp:Transcript_9316/g.26180  ORF Transcript_9316/g.26180 Transcript_9316/m.26180 type:complete len:408 (+) Transcript_9316:93-1316(+)
MGQTVPDQRERLLFMLLAAFLGGGMPGPKRPPSCSWHGRGSTFALPAPAQLVKVAGAGRGCLDQSIASEQRCRSYGLANVENMPQKRAGSRRQLAGVSNLGELRDVVAAAVSLLVAGILWTAPASAAGIEVSQTEVADPKVAFSPPEIHKRSSKRALQVAKALAERRAILFGAYWCPYSDRERQDLGADVWAKSTKEPKSGVSIPYIECDPRGLDARPELCSAVGVRSFPTWALADLPLTSELSFKLFPGARGLTGLEQLTGLAPAPPAEAPPVTGSSGPRELAVAKALSGSGVTMYGTYWCGFCDEQRQLFGREAWAEVPYVECDARCQGAQPEKCQAAGVTSFPTWVLPDGRQLKGYLTMERLESLVGTEALQRRSASAAPATVLPLPSGACEDCRVGAPGTELP